MRLRLYLRLFTALTATTLVAQASTSPLEGGFVPMPKTRPGQTAISGAIAPSPEITGAVVRPNAIAPVSGDLKAGLDALSDKQAIKAIAIRNNLKPGTLDRQILTWAIAVSGQPGVPSVEIASAQRALKGWPGLETLRANSERALYREKPSVQEILGAFGSSQPETTEGTIALTRALIAAGRSTEAAQNLRRLWFTEALDTNWEAQILREFPQMLTVKDHQRRLKMLLYRSRNEQALRFSTLGQAQSLYRAWVAVNKKSSNAGALVSNIDASWQNDPAVLFLRIELLRRDENYTQAAKLLAAMPREKAQLIDPGEWWVEQRVVARGLAERGNYKDAYRIVARHVADSPTDRVEAEFHAGWFALRGLGDKQTASRHFQAILDISNRPISASRALYWLGRSAEVGGPGDSATYYTRAAAFPGTFYGQLAAARLGRKTLNVTYPSPSDEDRARFESRDAVRAIYRLEAAGYEWRADSLYRALANSLTSPGELAILAAKAEKNRGHQLSLQIGKTAFAKGIDVAALAFPVGVIPASANIAGSGKALAYAIARQESAFNPAAVSPANARGLLQILPGTAKSVASRHGLSFSQARLTTDISYNATLGAHYLGEQIDDFGGSYILTFIAYNAGPRKVPEWIARYGDPRGKSIDEVVDWIEKIPYGETRNYVQRVMENYQVYKSRLGQKPDIVRDLVMGREAL
ncbi:lytic transglycosylase domain-containing protein [Rhizobium sp. CFBP 8762]|uniref:lytic transglycosylase domain-containing protein n=1 Tax=Rhizobium sp. CFBP 8762 TaxID=2775279 RepID=UPI0017810A25|nr:lytic transglycosylase domain-containing protein [Rhizobium sp. CFBP 8762]MBD8553120.1 lytic transglycosylase domain-containing protein [Rhizobium sp. CFBP 8762]